MKRQLIGRMTIIKGLSLFSFDTKTGKINIIDTTLIHHIDVEPGVIYRQCLNEKNFIRKLVKEGIINIEESCLPSKK